MVVCKSTADPRSPYTIPNTQEVHTTYPITIRFFPPTEVNRPETELSLLSLTDKCPFFPRFHGGFPFGGHLYLAMEECAMGTLGAYDAAPVPISWADR